MSLVTTEKVLASWRTCSSELLTRLDWSQQQHPTHCRLDLGRAVRLMSQLLQLGQLWLAVSGAFSEL